MNLDPKINCLGASVIRLGGVEYIVPAMALRQTRVAVPNLMTLMPALNRIQAGFARGEMPSITTEHFDLIVATVHAALTRAYPDATIDEVLDLGASFSELVAALAIVARQTGLFAQTSSENAPGE